MIDQKMPLPSPVTFVLDRLESAGFHAYAVGGCVRDHCMGRTPQDYDVTTSARPDEMQAVFTDCRVVETGLQHGTLTVVREGMNIEVTTYRIDGTYEDGRHPTSVTFTDRLEDDLCRRDFTVNAMAYSPKRGIVDLFGGMNDLEKGIIRCVGNAPDRFDEDGLRILRALRFSSVLGFTPDEECAAAVRNQKMLLDKISRERIHAELTKLLTGRDASRILRDFPDVVAHVIPGLTADGVTRCSEAMARDAGWEGMPKDPYLAYAALFDTLPPEEGRHAIDSLKPSREEKNAIVALLGYRNQNLELPAGAAMMTCLCLMRDCGDNFPFALARLCFMTGRCSRDAAGQIFALSQRILRENRCRRVSMLDVCGNDLMTLGLRGAAIGGALSRLLDGVMRGEYPNNRTALLRAAERMAPPRTESKEGSESQ